MQLTEVEGKHSAYRWQRTEERKAKRDKTSSSIHV